MVIRVILTGHTNKRGDTFQRASCPDLHLDPPAVVEGNGAIICKLARWLIEHDLKPAIRLDIRRDGTLCFDLLPVSQWARLTVKEYSNPKFVGYVPTPDSANGARQGHA